MGRNCLVPVCTLAVCCWRLSVSVSSKPLVLPTVIALTSSWRFMIRFPYFALTVVRLGPCCLFLGVGVPFLRFLRIYRLNNVGDILRAVVSSFLAIFSRVSVRAHVCARQRDVFDRFIWRRKVSLESVKRSVFSLYTGKGGRKGCQQKPCKSPKKKRNLQQHEINRQNIVLQHLLNSSFTPIVFRRFDDLKYLR